MRPPGGQRRRPERSRIGPALWVAKVLLCALCVHCIAENTVPPPGDVRELRPIEVLPEIVRYVGDDAQVITIRAQGVLPAGTVNLTLNKEAVLEYRFLNPLSGSSLTVSPAGNHLYEVVDVTVRQPGWRRFVRSAGMTRNDYSEYHRGMHRLVRSASDADREAATRAPRCNLRQLWKSAIAEGLPAVAPADVVYSVQGFRMQFADGSDRWFHDNCKPMQALSRSKYYARMRRLRWQVRVRKITRMEYLRRQSVLARRVAIGRGR